MLSACAAPQAVALIRTRPADPGSADRLPRAVRLAGVPFVAQQDWECGPASLAMILAAAGRPADVNELVAEVWIPARRGALQPEMLAAARRRGMLAAPLAPRLESMLATVGQGLPVVVFQNLGLAVSPVWHYAVLIGYDLDAGTVVLHTGQHSGLVQSIHPFERTWTRAGAWSMTATIATRLPAGATQETLVRSMAALERMHPLESRAGWGAVLTRWPDNPTAALGLGNSSWAVGDFKAAEAAWQNAVRLHPDFADAWNNLATALARRGELEAATQAARRAVAIGGPRLDDYRELLDSLSR